MWNKITSYWSAKFRHLYAFMAGAIFVNMLARVVTDDYEMAIVDFVCFAVLAHTAGLFSNDQ
jgi:hypothetical protein